MNQEPITSFRGEYRFLSNFWDSQVDFAGVSYPTVENAYQAAKAEDPKQRKLFRFVGPGEAKKLGKSLPLRSDWNQRKLLIMITLLHRKFSLPHLQEMLLATGGKRIIEGNFWHDTYWGQCFCKKHQGEGENKMGKILETLRREIRERNQ